MSEKVISWHSLSPKMRSNLFTIKVFSMSISLGYYSSPAQKVTWEDGASIEYDSTSDGPSLLISECSLLKIKLLKDIGFSIFSSFP